MAEKEVTALVLRDNQPEARALDRLAFEPQNWEQAIRTAEALAKSGLLPDALKNPAAVVAVIMQGRELGLTTMQSIRGIHVIQGKPTISAQLMVALILDRGLAEYFDQVESTDKTCTFETRRLGSERKISITWTIEMAAKAGLLTKQTWKQYPAAMLRARASAELARAVYPDVVFGLYDQDEIEHVATQTSAPDRSPRGPRKSRYGIKSDVTTILAEARASAPSLDGETAQAPDPDQVPPGPPPEPAPSSSTAPPPKLQVVPSTGDAQQPGPSANQAPDAAQRDPGDGNRPDSTQSKDTKAAQVFVSISDFWKRLRALGVEQKSVLAECVELFGAQPGQLAPELRGVYVEIKSAGLSIEDVSRELLDSFGIDNLPGTSIEAWVMYASLVRGDGGVS